MRAPTGILHFLLSQPSQISLQLPHPQRETHLFRTKFNIPGCFSSHDGENSPKNAPRKARTEHWKITRRKKTQRAVVPSMVKVVKAKSASLQGMRARDTRVRETCLLYSTTPPPFWANLLTIHTFCKLGLSLSYHLEEFLSLFLDFFSLWGHISPYTYRGGTKIKAASTNVPAAM